MDRDAMVRKQRRRHVGEALDDERGREAALAEQLEDVVAETDGAWLDERVFERLGPDDARLVRQVLPMPPLDWPEDAGDADADGIEREDADHNGPDAEIERLQEEIADSRRRQLAYERYLDALDA